MVVEILTLTVETYHDMAAPPGRQRMIIHGWYLCFTNSLNETQPKKRCSFILHWMHLFSVLPMLGESSHDEAPLPQDKRDIVCQRENPFYVNTVGAPAAKSNNWEGQKKMHQVPWSTSVNARKSHPQWWKFTKMYGKSMTSRLKNGEISWNSHSYLTLQNGDFLQNATFLPGHLHISS